MDQPEFIVGIRDLSSQQRELVQNTLLSVLDSPHFRKSKRYPAVLDFAVRNTLEGNLDCLKERNIGSEIFGRSPDYDTSIDPVVRIAAGEVRKRLECYFNENPDAPVRIDLPAGSYRAEFYFRTPLPISAPNSEHAVDPNPIRFLPPDTPHPATTIPKREASRPVRWALLSALLLLMGGGAAFWIHLRLESKRDLWAPLLRGRQQALIVVGEGPQPPSQGSAQSSAAETGVEQIPVGDALATNEICNVFHQYKQDCKIVPMQTAKLDDLLNKPVVSIGAFDNEWTLRLLAPLRFKFQADGTSLAAPHIGWKIADASQPQRVSNWVIDSSGIPQGTYNEYAIVARFHSEITDGPVLVVAGLGPPGTSGAAGYVSSPESFLPILALAPKDWKGLNFEAVLQIEVVQGVTGPVKVVAAQFW